ncbi:MAG: S8 family serine peptidase [Acidobacteria bacterium]|nr:S8 family serine peptidase [Acidobacteriota bacterium]
MTQTTTTKTVRASTGLTPRFRRSVTLIALIGLLYPVTSQAQQVESERLAPVLRERAKQLTGRSRVIVRFRGSADAQLIAGRGGVSGRRLGASDSQVAEIDNRALADLARNSQVARVSIDHPVFPTLDRTGAATAASLATQVFHATGRGIGVAVIDSGITAWHDDLYLTMRKARRGSPRVVHFKDFTTEGSPNIWASEQPSDEYGHGTHVAGIIAGSGFDSRGARKGIAPGAHLIGLKVLDAEGNGYMSNVIAAIDHAIAVKDLYNIRIINLSVATGVFESYATDPLTLAARRAVNAGIVVVAAAGNLGATAHGDAQWGGITSPGNAPWVLTVGAGSHEGTPQRSDDTLAPFSSRGPTWIDFSAKPDLVAPGVGTESLSDPGSTLYTTQADYLLDGVRRARYKPYLSMSGTSMAAPVVTGTVALMLQVNPALTPNAVKAILQYTAQSREGAPLLAQGAGHLNALGAVRMASFFGSPQNGPPLPLDVIEDEPVKWSRQILWGNHRIRGGLPLPGGNAWTLDVTWGTDAAPTGERLVWGIKTADNIVWSTGGDDNIVWSTGGGDNIVWSTGGGDNIVWSTGGGDNIVWSTGGDDNIVWSTGGGDNIVWSTGGGDNIVWSTGGDDNIAWSTGGGDNIVWSTRGGDNVVWSTGGDDNIVWSTGGGDNIVWSTGGGDNIVWSTGGDDNIVWSTGGDDNIVWSTRGGDNIVWSTGSVDQTLWTAAQPVDKRRGSPSGRNQQPKEQR